MGIIEVFCLFLFLECVFTEEDALLKPCAVEDIDCLSQTTEKFLEKTSAGIPQFDIKPIDPLLIPSIDVTFPEYILHSKNLKITGLKNQKISVFTMNKASKSVVLATSTTLNIVADVSLELPKLSKVFAGNYSIITDALATARYNYDLKTDASGVEHFEVGPETISCENLKSPVMTLNQELVEALRKDPDIQSMYEKNKKEEYQKGIACNIIKEAYVTVVHNIRASAKNFPKTAFFTNV